MIAAWLGLATARDVAELSARVEHSVAVAAEVQGWQATLLREVRDALAELYVAAAALRAAVERERPLVANRRAAIVRAAKRGRRARKKARPA